MNNSDLNMMFQDAINNLSNGCINLMDKEILSYSPLPDCVTGPYVTQDVDPLQTMNMTNEALNAWVDESKKASYFTTHFVTLSRMIMNGVSTMARGLVTLHMKGEDLDQAPLSIGDLISISSCQFRKSYLGVLQTVKSHPEISERLLLNQLRWNNTLMKLFKTKDRLSRKPVIKGHKPEIDQTAVDQHLITEPDGYDARALSSLNSGGISELSALSDPGAYGPVQAYSPYMNKNSKILSQKSDSSCLPGVSEDLLRTDETGIDEIYDSLGRDPFNEHIPAEDDKAVEDSASGNESDPVVNGLSDQQRSSSDQNENPLKKGNLPEPETWKSDDFTGSDGCFTVESILPAHPPDFLGNLSQAVNRWRDPDETMVFPEDETDYLLEDPEYHYDRGMAADFRNLY